jgi:Mlc titration factor MtfA (ptsG expression regulator)
MAAMFGFFRRRRRAKLRREPLTDEQWAAIEHRVPIVAHLRASDRRELGGIVQILLAEKRFEGCGGLEMTDEIRLVIAAQAGLLLLHQKHEDRTFYPTLDSILVYPQAYVANARRVDANGVVTEGPVGRLGESWYRGALVLSWDDVVRGAADDQDGHNVVLHEFAHQLDGESGAMEGAPALPSAARYRDWARVLGHEYKELADDLHHGHRTLLDPYAATNPAEFFAVATEAFFEKPRAMRHSHPELYEQLAGFYRQDPASWGRTG